MRKPKDSKNGKHRRTSTKTHDHSAERTDNGAGRTRPLDAVPLSFCIPKPEPIPYAGIRAGELIGYRLWWVIRRNYICSLAHRRLWKPEETVRGDISKIVASHAWNVVWGGIYSFSSPEEMFGEKYVMLSQISDWGDRAVAISAAELYGVWSALAETSIFVTGTIKMWGDVVEHETGYRAEYAKLQSLDEIYGSDWGHLESLRRKYLPQ